MTRCPKVDGERGRLCRRSSWSSAGQNFLITPPPLRSHGQVLWCMLELVVADSQIACSPNTMTLDRRIWSDPSSQSLSRWFAYHLLESPNGTNFLNSSTPFCLCTGGVNDPGTNAFAPVLLPGFGSTCAAIVCVGHKYRIFCAGIQV